MKKNLLVFFVILSSLNLKAQTQNGWYFCSKCTNLFFETAKGVCATGGNHTKVKSSSSYTLSYGTSNCKGQADWYFCNKCACIFFGPNNLKCTTGGKHQSDPNTISSYILCYTKNGAVIDANHQSEWYFCNKCSCLFFGQQSAGVCAEGDKHFFTNETSGNYVLPHF